MSSNSVLKSAVAFVAACTMWAGSAQAATHALNLTGVVGDIFYFPQEVPPLHFDRYFLQLQGISPSQSINVSVGDFIETNVTLDEVLTVPASVDFTNFSVFLSGSKIPAINTAARADFIFYDENGLSVKTYTSPIRTTSSQIPAVAFFPFPDNGAFQFKSFTSIIEITTLGQTVTLDRAVILYDLASPAAVPEPATWAMMIIGFGGVGALMRRNRGDRRRSAFA